MIPTEVYLVFASTHPFQLIILGVIFQILTMNFLARLLGRSKPEAKDVVVEVIESVSELSSSSSSPLPLLLLLLMWKTMEEAA